MEETVGHQRARRNSLFTQTVIWVTGLVCLAFLLGSLAQAWSNSQLMQRVQSAEQQLQQSQSHHNALAHLADHYKDASVIEDQAREQLGYIRPGEHLVVVISPADQGKRQVQNHMHSSAPGGFWQEWWNALFGN
jgi:cell division protein FtsB